MNRFKDEKTQQIYITRFALGVPQNVSIAAHELMHPLCAAHSLQDVGVLGTIERILKPPDRFGLHVQGKWYVTFAWFEDFGAHAIELERR